MTPVYSAWLRFCSLNPTAAKIYKINSSRRKRKEIWLHPSPPLQDKNDFATSRNEKSVSSVSWPELTVLSLQTSAVVWRVWPNWFNRQIYRPVRTNRTFGGALGERSIFTITFHKQNCRCTPRYGGVTSSGAGYVPYTMRLNWIPLKRYIGSYELENDSRRATARP